MGSSVKTTHPDYHSSAKEVRRQLHISQEDLAGEMGVIYTTINRWESGCARRSPLALKQIEELLRGLGEEGRELLEAFLGEEA